MDSAIRFERWLRRLEFNLAIFRPKRTDCAISSDPTARKRNECIRQMARGGAVSDAEQRMLLEPGKRRLRRKLRPRSGEVLGLRERFA